MASFKFLAILIAISACALAQDATLRPGQTAHMTATAKGTPPFRWQWYKDGVRISGATTGTYSTKEAGSYSVTAENSAGWAASNKFVIAVVAPTPLPTPTPTPSPIPTPTPTPAIVRPSQVIVEGRIQ